MMAKGPDKNIVSGNSRVKVTIYGQVNRAIRFANTGDDTEITSIDNDGSSSRIGIRAVGKANKNTTIGALHELEWQYNRRSGVNEDTEENSANYQRVRARHVDLWVEHKDLGKLSMGHGSIAGDAAGLFEVTGVSHVFGFAGASGADGTKADATVKVLAPGQGAITPLDGSAATPAAGVESTMNVTGKARGFRPFNFFGARQNRIRYDTPSLMGARVSVSYNSSGGAALWPARSWSVGLTYAGSPPGVKDFSALFAAGYRKNDMATAAAPETAWAVSGGIKHSSGFNLSGSYDSDADERANGAKQSMWGVSAGWTGKINDAGSTAIGIGYTRSADGLHGIAQQYWLAINQNVDAAAADVYAGVAYDSGTLTHTVSAAEAANTYTDAVTETQTVDGADGFRAKATPCYTAGTNAGEFVRAAKGDTCEIQRDGVFVFVAGIRLKF